MSNDVYMMGIFDVADRVQLIAFLRQVFSDADEVRVLVSPTGNAPATHAVVCGWWPKRVVDALPMGHMETDTVTNNIRWVTDRPVDATPLRQMILDRAQTPPTRAQVETFMGRQKFMTDPAPELGIPLMGNELFLLERYGKLKVIQGEA